MGHPDTRVHYLDRVNVSTRPYYPANVKIRIEAKKDKVWSTIYFYYLAGLNRDGEKFNLGFLL